MGRTGSLLAIDIALEQAKKKGCVDIPAIVASLRRQRMKMVQSRVSESVSHTHMHTHTCTHTIQHSAVYTLTSYLQKQYMFIHDAVLEQLVCGDTQIPTQDFNRALLKLQQTELKDGVFKTGFALQFDVRKLTTLQTAETSS